ncbi:hypothetical protein [Celerinatantimonas yamalensis]|uniref:Uncharacterized protein n=1 Tax=Celerinatantimonas yamalensis TaxID=559956 RepID=A0ABW9GBC1_9GAMM
MKLIIEFFNAVIIATVGLFSLEAISVQYNTRSNERSASTPTE